MLIVFLGVIFSIGIKDCGWETTLKGFAVAISATLWIILAVYLITYI